MSPGSSVDLLTLSNTQAKELAGRFVTISGATYFFKNYDADQPGNPPWRTGAEGKAYPLLDYDHSVAAYLKFFTLPTRKRLDRTAWLIGQQMHTWLPGLAAAPLVWTDTRQVLHGTREAFQFAGYLAKAVPGETWLERKHGIAAGSLCLSEDLRWRCVRGLLLSLAVLERAGLVHGDLSPNNVVIDLDPRLDEPALYLIDFDAFAAPAAGANRVVTVAEGGTYGTDGYCPPDLAAAAATGDGSVAPYSDRYGRDMLLLELLLMDRGLSPDDPPSQWDCEQLQRRYAAWRARSDASCSRALEHLEPARAFSLAERERPASADLVTGLGLSLPERRVLRRVTELPRPTPAILGRQPARASTESVSPLPDRGKVPDGLQVLRRWPRFGWGLQRCDDLPLILFACFLLVVLIFRLFVAGLSTSSPIDAREYWARGLAYGQKGEVDKAIADFTEAIRIFPSYVGAYYDRGLAYGQKGESDEAIADFTEAIRLAPQFADAYYERAQAYEKKGNRAKADADSAKAEKLGISLKNMTRNARLDVGQ